MAKRVGIVGIGIMGTAMMRNLLRDGFEVVGYDITEAAMGRLAEAGGIAAGSPRDVAEKTEILITSLPSGDAFEQVMTGQGGIASSNGTGQIVIECSTLPIDVKALGQAQLAAQGKILLDCPVSGTGAQAAVRDLVVFASGDEAAFDRCRDVLAGISRAQKYVGTFGNGSRMKFIANHLVTIHNLAAAEALVLGEMAGLDPALVFNVIADSAGSSRMFQIRGPMMVKGRYDQPTATMTTHLKDLDIIGKFAADLHCPTPLFTVAAQFYHAAVAQGRGGEDTGAICTVLENLAGIERKR
ncbi:MAG: NAD(P)-dependent oxidoreductase [Alphaproteobacteria bacterium]|nr:NAD(P)-dependent oxidoreductase [Alphaproteobacteria bacterium]